VMEPKTMVRKWRPTARTMGEIMFRGNIVMKGYLKKTPRRPRRRLAGGWFHTGRPCGARARPLREDSRDRSKDIIIFPAARTSARSRSRMRCIAHPAVLACAVVAKPDPKWGETPLAFIELKAGCRGLRGGTDRSLQGAAGPATRSRARSASRPIPKTSTGKIQKFQAARGRAPLDRSVSNRKTTDGARP